MKKLTSIAVLLTIAAALATTVISCSSEDNLTEQPQQPVEQPTAEPRTVHVTVGAGLADGGDATRSAVVNDGGTRKLTFTEGDRLYVWGTITGTDPGKIVAGYLDMVGTPASGATTATFSGDLAVYEKSGSIYVSSSYTFATDDPLSECGDVEGTLIHEDADGFFVDEDDKYGDYMPVTASSVDELMTKNLIVSGLYDSMSKQFVLSAYVYYDDDTYCAPIFNCTISGLKPNTTYNVSHVSSSSGLEYTIDNHGRDMGTVTSDADGKATFACYTVCEKETMYHILNFISEDDTDQRNVYLGTKALESKVYNITREALKFQEAAFSVSDTKQVYFSKGNLYARTDNLSKWEWYFQSHQWKYVGNSGGNGLITGSMSISSAYKNVDLFCWNGESASDDNYGIHNSGDIYGEDYGSVNGENLKHDWGYNVIGNDPSGKWRTPTKSEWEYLLTERTVSNSLSGGARYTMATIGDKYKGLVLFPDSYTHPSGAGYTAGTYNAASDYTTAVTFEFWMQMENAGCIFLPAAGSRYMTTVFTDSEGYYWSSSSVSTSGAAYNIRFTKSKVDLQETGSSRSSGYSVRLVRDVE